MDASSGYDQISRLVSAHVHKFFFSLNLSAAYKSHGELYNDSILII